MIRAKHEYYYWIWILRIWVLEKTTFLFISLWYFSSVLFFAVSKNCGCFCVYEYLIQICKISVIICREINLYFGSNFLVTLIYLAAITVIRYNDERVLRDLAEIHFYFYLSKDVPSLQISSLNRVTVIDIIARRCQSIEQKETGTENGIKSLRSNMENFSLTWDFLKVRDSRNYSDRHAQGKNDLRMGRIGRLTQTSLV